MLADRLRSLDDIARDLDCADFYAGAARVTTAFLQVRYFARAFEIEMHPNSPYNDIMSPEGFAVAILFVLGLRVGGLMVAGWDCSSWGFMNLSMTQRHEGNGYMGDPSYWPVQRGNELFRRTLLLFRLCHHRDCHFLGENPSDSLFEKTQRWRDFLAAVPDTNRLHMWMEPYGHSMTKGTILVSTAKWLDSLKWELQSKSKLRTYETMGWVRSPETGRVSGKPGLRLSATYPILFCSNVARLFAEFDQPGLPDLTWRGSPSSPRKQNVADLVRRGSVARSETRLGRRVSCSLGGHPILGNPVNPGRVEFHIDLFLFSQTTTRFRASRVWVSLVLRCL